MTLGFDDVQAVCASDAELAAHVADADLPSLLPALAVLTGDEGLIAEELRPPRPPMVGTIAPQGGMSPETQRLARQRAVAALIRYRDAGSPPLSANPPLLDAAMGFVAHDAGPGYAPLLRHELGLPHDLGAPDFRLEELAPGRNFRVAIIGAGLSGIAAAHRLRQAGIPFVVFEKQQDVGGVWQANAYPGCRLDTPNFAYSYAFAQKADWPQQFSTRAEVQGYAAAVTDRAGLREHIRFGTEVTTLQFQDETADWHLTWKNADGRIDEGRFDAVISAVGQLDRPFIPAIPGLEAFAGRYHHSAEWPQDLDLTGKRVAVMGTGASAFQIVPAIADRTTSLHVVQRNPPWMLPTPNYHHDIKPGMAWLLRHVPSYGRWYRFWQFWVAAEGRLPLVQVEPDWHHPVSVGRANEALRQECLANLAAQFEGRPDLLAAMTPNYPPGAKRMLRDNGVWARALKSPHVRLVTSGIERIEGRTLHFGDGSTAEVDVIIFATGFQASDYLMPMRVIGREGRDLHAQWQGDARAYLGITVPGYPNLFMMAGPNTSVVVNGSAVFSIECAVSYTLSALRHILESDVAALDCRDSVMAEYNARIDAGNLTKAWGVARTTSWYRNAAGRASQTWPFTLMDYWSCTRALSPDDYVALPRPSTRGTARARVGTRPAHHCAGDA